MFLCIYLHIYLKLLGAFWWIFWTIFYIDAAKVKQDRAHYNAKQKNNKQHSKANKNKGSKDNSNELNFPAYDRVNNDGKPMPDNKKVSYGKHVE